eukprot:gene19720-30391_t
MFAALLVSLLLANNDFMLGDKYYAEPQRPAEATDEMWTALSLMFPIQYYLGKSSIHGVGLFAGQAFQKGDTVMSFEYSNMKMTWVPYSVIDMVLRRRPAEMMRWHWATNGTHAFLPTTTNMGHVTSRSTMWVHYLNHGEGEAVNIKYSHADGRYTAVRDIPEDEEILINY